MKSTSYKAFKYNDPLPNMLNIIIKGFQHLMTLYQTHSIYRKTLSK